MKHLRYNKGMKWTKEKNREYQKEWYHKNRKNNPAYTKKRKKYNKEWRKRFGGDYRKKNLDKIRSYDREWKQQYKIKNPELVRVKRIERYYRERQNPEHIEKRRAYMRVYLKKWRQGNNKLAACMRTRMNMAIRQGKKSTGTSELIGISISGLKKYLEKQFQGGMDWDNYGKWHIDHIKPLSSFDLTKPEEQKKAFHYTNLQPLWAKENVSKGAKLLIK